ncbi:TrkA family potassium uptake protein [Halopenitus sp. H-Gu1]|uniref:potassium channel family protein n=1 Tax=Halopenitus sp. H-Gu1 TaxID=3242697 RepID=UPI00359D1717
MTTQDLRIVVVGGGRVGLRTARTLDNRGHDVIVIERDPARSDRIADEYVATVIEGDATKPSILKQAGLSKTDVLVALTADLGTNLATCLTAERYGAPIRTVMRRTEEDTNEYADLVDATIFPERSGARAAVNAVDPGVRALEDMIGDLEILVMEVTEQAPVAGRLLTDVALPEGSLIVSDSEGDTTAGAETVLEAGQSYVVATEPSVEDEVVRLFRG